MDRTTRAARSAETPRELGIGAGPSRLLPWDHAALAEALGAVVRLSEQSESRLLELMIRFLRYVERGCGVESLGDVTQDDVRGFVLAASSGPEKGAPSVATSHLRRSAVRLLFRVLRQASVVDHDPTLDLVLPRRSSLAARPLTDDEVALGRSFSLKSLTETRQPAAWALAESTARTSELSAVCVRDVDLDARRVWIAGAAKTRARWGKLSDWAVQTLEQRIAAVGNSLDTPLVYEGHRGGESRQASACAAISETLRRAGLSGEPDVRPISVTAWAGNKILEETGRIEDVATALGVRSLDRAARLIGWDWTTLVCSHG